jgi:MFS family permease
VPVFLLAAVLTGLGMGLLFLIGTTLVAQNAPAEIRGQVFAALYLIAYTALGVPAVVAALAAEQIGLIPAYHVLAAVFGSVGVIALAVVLAGRRPR